MKKNLLSSPVMTLVVLSLFAASLFTAASLQAQTAGSGFAPAAPANKEENNRVMMWPAACPADAKACPDGSYVSRTGPNCEFAPCSGSRNNVIYQDPVPLPTPPQGCDVYGEPSCTAKNGCEPIYVTECNRLDPAYVDQQCTKIYQGCKSLDSNLKICLTDVKACPDGSYVSRTGPNCSFAACPGTTNRCQNFSESLCKGDVSCRPVYGMPTCPEGRACNQMMQFVGCQPVDQVPACENLSLNECLGATECRPVYESVCPPGTDKNNPRCSAPEQYVGCEDRVTNNSRPTGTGVANESIAMAERRQEREARMMTLTGQQNAAVQAVNTLTTVENPLLSEARQSRIMERVKSISNLLQNTANRLSQVANRMQVRLASLESNGQDVAEAKKAVTEVANQIEATQAGIGELVNLSNTVLATNDPQTQISLLRDSVYALREQLRLEREGLQDTLAILREKTTTE